MVVRAHSIASFARILGHRLPPWYVTDTAAFTGLGDFLGEKGFGSVREVVGHSLPYFTTHHDLADRQKAKKEGTEKSSDMQWGDDLTTTTQELMTN